MSKVNSGTIPQLTSLRFFAAFAILLLHFRDYLAPAPESVRLVVIGGYVGVTFFFVLSGFILTYNYESLFAEGIRLRDFWRFQKFRFARIYPTYLLALCLDTPVLLLLRRAPMDDAGHYPWDYGVSWIVNAIGVQSWIPVFPYVLFWNIPSWSISTEFFFYLCFPFICGFMARTIKDLTHAIALSVFVVALTIGVSMWVVNEIYIVNAIGFPPDYAVQNYLPPLRIPEFIVGCIAGRIFIESQSRSLKYSFFNTEKQRNLTLIILISLVFWRSTAHQYDGPEKILWMLDQGSLLIEFAIPFAGIILAIASGKTVLSKLLAWPWLILLGESSYALYIMHYAGVAIRETMFGSDKRAVLSIIFMLVSVAYSVAIFLFFEQPVRKKLRSLKFFRE
ncbi:MAG: acyltransferase [Cyanobacteria bacterium SZAS-4]|nr:acyltransferase [Cyanobacteria bacterium SZAS-4]